MTYSSTNAKTSHVIVLGNEKGGTGKSTLALQLAVSLMLEGMRVATIDLDGRQQTLTSYIRNRRTYAKVQGLFLPTPDHHVLEQAATDSLKTNKWSDTEAFTRILASLEQRVDFIVIDCPSSNCPLSLMAHAAADTLLTPMNDSLVDIDTLAHLKGENVAPRPSLYTETVLAARNDRQSEDNAMTDWVVMRNRLVSGVGGHRHVGSVLEKLSAQFGMRVGPGLSEHAIFREYFDKGLTALDSVECFEASKRPTVEHMASRQELMALIEHLNLPLDDRSVRRRQAREIWRESANLPLELTEILA